MARHSKQNGGKCWMAAATDGALLLPPGAEVALFVDEFMARVRVNAKCDCDKS